MISRLIERKSWDKREVKGVHRECKFDRNREVLVCGLGICVARLDSEIADIMDINCKVIHSRCKIIFDDIRHCLINIFMYLYTNAYG